MVDVAETVVRHLTPRAPALRDEWARATPFPHIVVDNFLPRAVAVELLAAFPTPDDEGWDTEAYIHQQRKLTRSGAFAAPIGKFFELTARPEFRALLSQITGIPHLLDDPELVGGGCHQILPGGFLDVHVDFNLHPSSGLYRRLNLLVYLNEHWDADWKGALELWDMQARRRAHSIEPLFNRAVLFETSEISYHGHPTPLAAPASVTRKSLAVYYYTATIEGGRASPEHNTLYRNTTGLKGRVKTVASIASVAKGRTRSAGIAHVARRTARKLSRRLRRLPPENR
jgi:hypothetical protein